MLLNGDCLEEMKALEDDSVDVIFCDLPYGQTSCKWDTCINLDEFWIEVMRVKKLRTPIFMTTTTKFGASLINSAPKKCPFRYDLVWVKSAPAGFLSAKKMPMRKHEMVYVFYEKLPFYDLSSHTHKFLKDGTKTKDNSCYGVQKLDVKKQYNPPLPVSVVKEPEPKSKMVIPNSETYGKVAREQSREVGGCQVRYDPPLPVSVVKEPEPEPEATMGDCYGDVERNLEQYKACGKKGKNQVLYDPPLPVSVVKEEEHNNHIKDGQIYNGGKGMKVISDGKGPQYDPPLPNSMLEIKSTRGKHSTEKPVALMEWILKYYSKEGDVVLDPTMGSGSTGVACNNMNRNFIGIELDPDIYEVAVNRIED